MYRMVVPWQEAGQRPAAGGSRNWQRRLLAVSTPVRDPAQITPGALVVAGDEEAAAVCQVVDLAPAGDGTIVHPRLLPGLVDDYRALIERAMASASRLVV
jgi:hypothetical protein